MAKEYHKKITVQTEHLDERNHVNNVVYLQWVQDVSEEHWLSKTDQELNSNYFWVVRSHQLNYKKQVFGGDQITIKTYVANFKGPFSERVVEFYKEDELVVSSISNWCFLAISDLKPTRIPEEIQELF